MSDTHEPQKPIQQFGELLPLTLGIAGLSLCERGQYFNEEQMEMRARAIKRAYQQALELAKEITTD